MLVIADQLDTSRGGQERSVREYLDALAGRGADVSLLCRRLPSSEIENVTCVRLECHTGGEDPDVSKFIAAAEEHVRTCAPGVVVHTMLPVRGAHYYMPRGGLFPEAYARSTASHANLLARWLSALGQRFNSKRRKLVGRERALLSDPSGPVLIALSEYVAAQAERHYGMPRQRIRVVRNGVALQPGGDAGTDREAHREFRGIPDDAVVFLAVAHNHRLKGIPTLLQAVRLLPIDKNWSVVIAGGERTAVTGPEGRVRFVGSVRDVSADIAAADVLVHPTFYDPSSRVVLEALAAGKPVVTTRWNGAADFLKTGAGLVIEDPADARQLAGAMTTLLDDEKRGQAGEAASKLSYAVSMARHTDELLNLFSA